MLDGMWTFLLVGGFGAIGAAAAVGTLTALVSYWRTGNWPGQEPGVPVSTGRIVGLWVRVVVGLAVAAWATVSLVNDGLLL